MTNARTDAMAGICMLLEDKSTLCWLLGTSPRVQGSTLMLSARRSSGAHPDLAVNEPSTDREKCNWLCWAQLHTTSPSSTVELQGLIPAVQAHSCYAWKLHMAAAKVGFTFY